MDSNSEAAFLRIMAPELATDDQLRTVQFLADQLVEHQPGVQEQAYECAVPDDSVSVRLMTSLDIGDPEAGFGANVQLNLKDSALDSLFMNFEGNNQLSDLAPAFETADMIVEYIKACDDLLDEARLDDSTTVIVVYLKKVLTALIRDTEVEGSAVFEAIPQSIMAADDRMVHPAEAIRCATRARLGNGHWLMRELEPELANGNQLTITKHEPRGLPLSEDPDQPLMQIYYDDRVGNISYVLTTDQFGQVSLEVTPIGSLIRSEASDTAVETTYDEDSATELIIDDFLSEFADASDRPLADDVQVLIDVLTTVVIDESGFTL